MNYKSYLLEQNLGLLKQNITLFYGENLGLKDDFKKEIKHKYKDAGFYNFTSDEVLSNEDSFFNKLLNNSLFEKDNIFFIDNVNDKILQLIETISTKIDNQKLYLFSDILEKKSKLRNYFEKSKDLAIVPCYSDNEISLRKIILNSLRDFSGLSQQNINLILDNCMLDRVRLKNELDKIKMFFENKKINSEMLIKLLNIKVNANFNLLRDEAFRGNKRKTNQLLSDTVIDNDRIMFYLSVINQRLIKLSEVAILSKNTSLENAINSVKPPIFWKDKPIFNEHMNKWNLEKIRRTLKNNYELEVEIKSSNFANCNLLIKKLMVDICSVASS